MTALIQILQTAISPVTLISGVGLLVLSMTNRFARTTDRARELARAARRESPDLAANQHVQIQILYRRSRLLLYAISLALASVFFISVVIVSLFIGSVLNLDQHVWIGILFTLSLISLTLSLVLFIRDMTLALQALKLELKDHL
jgi:hypothetical protein